MRSVADLVKFAKARPGQLNYARAAAGGPTHLSAELFKAMTGVDIVATLQVRKSLFSGVLLRSLLSRSPTTAHHLPIDLNERDKDWLVLWPLHALKAIHWGLTSSGVQRLLKLSLRISRGHIYESRTEQPFNAPARHIVSTFAVDSANNCL